MGRNFALCCETLKNTMVGFFLLTQYVMIYLLKWKYIHGMLFYEKSIYLNSEKIFKPGTSFIVRKSIIKILSLKIQIIVIVLENTYGFQQLPAQLSLQPILSIE